MKPVRLIPLLLTLCLSVAQAEPPRVATTDLYRASSLRTYAENPDAEYPRYRAAFRKRFSLPQDDPVWQAVVNVSEGSDLYVNGHRVRLEPEETQRMSNWVQGVDISDRLTPGENVLAIEVDYQKKPIRYAGGNPFIYVHGRVVLRSGRSIMLDTDASWRATETARGDWRRSGYDDANWEQAEVNPSLYTGLLDRRWPAYDGRMVYENPDRKWLFFSDAKPAILRVRCPRGLAGRNPQLRYRLYRVLLEGREESVTDGAVEAFATEGDSIAFAVDLGRLERGVYTLGSDLVADGETVERRVREPFIVVGRIPMKEVRGESFDEGLDKELETTIDFTDPDDPHPNIETVGIESGRPAGGEPLVAEPRIVRENGLVYRETAPKIRSMFSYRFEFEHPGDWYLIELDYPDNATRWIGVSIAREAPTDRQGRRARTGYLTDSGPGTVTGWKYPVSGEMRTLRWLHRGEPGANTFDVVSLFENGRAAASRARIYHVKGNLTALQTRQDPERFIGHFIERPRHMGYNFGINDPGPYEMFYDRMDADAVLRHAHRLAWQLDVSEHYAQYLRFCGMNLAVTGAYQYNEDNHSYVEPNHVETSRINRDIREVALHVFEENGITMISMIEWAVNRGLLVDLNPGAEEIAAGADTVFPINKSGKTASGFLTNYCHPEVRKAHDKIIEDLARKFAHSPAWKGVYLMNFVHHNGIGMVPAAPPGDPFGVDYSDATIALFEEETGIEVPGEGPDRFEARHAFLTAPEQQERWRAFRCEQVYAVVDRTLDILKRYRDDLQVQQMFYIADGQIRGWLNSGRPYEDYIRDWGMDASLYQQDPNVWFGRTDYPLSNFMPARGLPGYAAVWEHVTNPEALAAYDRPINRFSAHRTGWLELTLTSGQAEDWPFILNKARFLPHAAGDYRREVLTQTMIGSDAEMQMFGFADVGLLVGHEQALREFTRAMTALPRQKLQALLDTGFDTKLALRGAEADGAYWFTVANPGFWPIEGSVIVRGAEKITDAVTGEAVETQSTPAGLVMPVALSPYGFAAFRADTPAAAVVGWGADKPPAEAVEYLKQLIEYGTTKYPRVRETMGFTDEQEQVVLEGAREATELLGSGRFAAAWNRLTDYQYWTLAVDRVGGLDLSTENIYQCFMDQFSVRGIVWHDEPVLGTGRIRLSAYFANPDPDQAFPGFFFDSDRRGWVPELEKTQEAPEAVYLWDGKLRTRIPFGQRITLKKDAVEWELWYEAHAAIKRRPGYGWVEYEFISESELFQNIGVDVIHTDGTREVFRSDPKKTEGTARAERVRGLRFHTPKGPVLLECGTTEENLEWNNAFNVVVTYAKNEETGEPMQKWSITWTSTIPEGATVPQGYRNEARIRLSFPGAR